MSTVTQAAIDALFSPRSTSDEDDELFGARRAPLPATARITCRVCIRPAEVPLDTAGLLCGLCREDTAAALVHVRTVASGALWATEEAWMRLEADVAHADETTRARWNAYQDAITAGDPRVAATEAAVRAGRAGSFADLVSRWLAYQDAHRRLIEVERWRALALEELEAAEPGAAERYRELHRPVAGDVF